MVNQPDNSISTRVFISYSRKDQNFVRKLHTILVERGFDTWVDWEGIPLSADWWAEIESGIEGSDAFVFIISPDSLKSKVCGDEIQNAVENHKRIIPILHREPEKGDPIHPKISSHNWVFMRNEEELNKNIGDMVTTINTDLDWVKAHTRFLERASEWQSQSLNSSFLLRGDDLNSAEKWLQKAAEDKEPAPTDLQIDYIHASRRDATRRRRLTFGGIGVGLVIAVLAIIAIVSAIEARRQRDNAAKSLEEAALSSAKRLVQPIVTDYEIEDAIAKVRNEFGKYDYEIGVAAESVVAQVMLESATSKDFMSISNNVEAGDLPTSDETISMYTIFRKALTDEPEIAAESDFDLALLYTKFCHQIPALNNHKSVLPACTSAIEMTDEVENAWLSFQVCNFKNLDQLKSLAPDIEKICNEFRDLEKPVTVGQSFQDSIEPGSNDVWRINPTENETVYIQMKAVNSDLDSFLEIYDNDGIFIIGDDQSGENNDALVVFTPESSNAYHIVARGFDQATSGDYELVVSTEEPEIISEEFAKQADSRGELQIGESIQDSLAPGELHGWTFRGEAGQVVSIYMGAVDSEVDSFLTLIGPSGDFIAEDDDGGGGLLGLDSQIIAELPDSGQYLIQASSFDFEFGEGDYVLELEEGSSEAFAFEEPLGELTVGTAVSGTLVPGNEDYWTFSGSSGDVVGIAMVADGSDVDPFLTLLGPDGSYITDDDDSFGNYDALINTELPISGIYTVIASGFDISTEGAYLLELSDDSFDFSLGEPTIDDYYYPVAEAFLTSPSTLFTQPNETSQQLADIPEGAILDVVGRSENGSWLYVQYVGDPFEGFVSINRIELLEIDIDSLPVIGGAAEASLALEEDEGITSSPTTVFDSPDANAASIGNIASGEVLTINGRSPNGSWFYVTYLTEDGEELGGFVAISRVLFDGVIESLPVVDDGGVISNEVGEGEAIASTAATIFDEPDSNSLVVGNIPAGSIVSVDGRSQNSSWLYVSFVANGETLEGFVSARLIDYEEDINALQVINTQETINAGEARATTPTTIFSSPDANSPVVGSIPTGGVMLVDGRSQNGSWLFVAYFDENDNLFEGFVANSLVNYEGNINSLPVIDELPEIEESEPITDTETIEEDSSGFDVGFGAISQPATIYADATSDSEVVTFPEVGDEIAIIGRSENGSWLFIIYTDELGDTYAGYVSTNRVDFDGSLDDIPIGGEELLSEDG